MNTKTIKLGSRGSKLALAQTQEVITALTRAHPGVAVETIIIRTTGDKVQNRLLTEEGGKAAFTKEIEEALESGQIDVGVHSAKDMQTHLAEGLTIGGVLPRGDPRDAFFSRTGHSLSDLAPGSLVGTSSPRRQALVLAARPDLKVGLLRGNVDTRLKKLEDGEIDATLLAVAGLARLGELLRIQHYMNPVTIVPAAGQGAIALEIRESDQPVAQLLSSINCKTSEIVLKAERAVITALEGSCRSPIAAWGQVEDGQFTLHALVAKPDGSDVKRLALIGPLAEAESLGAQAGHLLKGRLPPGYF